MTKDKFILGRRLEEIERIFAFRRRRFHLGIVVARLNPLPGLTEFDLAAYSITAEHRYQAPTDLDLIKLKKIAAGSWTLTGPERLVKVRPVVLHDTGMNPDDQYPPGAGRPSVAAHGAATWHSAGGCE